MRVAGEVGPARAPVGAGGRSPAVLATDPRMCARTLRLSNKLYRIGG